MDPWHDCPPCPKCGLKLGTPIEQGGRAYRDEDLFCPACGDGWVGTPPEVAQAKRAWTAWEAEQERQEAAYAEERKRELDRRKYERLMKGGW